MQDTYRREINYLRISVTDRCNMRCVYCMPEEGLDLLSHREILTFEEIEKVVRAAATLGVKKVRLTGGEPLIRKRIENLVRAISAIPGIDDVAMTTNAVLLPPLVGKLKEAGLKRVNISLDTLRADRFREITRGGDLAGVWEGIRAALDAGLRPVKLNTVVIRGFNDDEVAALARLTLNLPLHIRFIELMPVGPTGDWAAGKFVPAGEIAKAVTDRLGPLEAAKEPAGGGPAKYYRLKGAAGTIGFITALSDHFCDRCNRLRLTSSGGLRLCLYDKTEADLKTPLREGAGTAEIARLIEQAIVLKPDRHHLAEGRRDRRKAMSQIGG
ncbi:MAG: GTP 3',8-cyclase MoaA [Firmicutes bacterium]|nr:GTP 3',8-cyclase MoaA [Bacillota bacterium]